MDCLDFTIAECFALSFLSLLLFCVSADPGLLLRVPSLSRGDELTYQGKVLEVGEQIDKRFRKEYELEIKLFVLEAQAGTLECALMTKLRPRLDPAVAGSADALTGAEQLRQSSSAVRLDLLRVDNQGRIKQLLPSTKTQPFNLQQAEKQSLADLPLDMPSSVESGMFLPLPKQAVRVGDRWQTIAENRPPLEWKLQKIGLWNGSQCLELQLIQQSDGWQNLQGLKGAWRRSEELLLSPSDGLVHKLNRRIERREGANVIGWVETQFELLPVTRRLGGRYDDVRREIELAYSMQEELRLILANQTKISPALHRLAISKYDRFVELQPVPGPFRDALDSGKRRWNAAARGEMVHLQQVVQREKANPMPRLGEIVPDFTVPRLDKLEHAQLARFRGKPTLLHFFRAGSATAKDSLSICEACSKRFSVQVLSIAVRGSSQEAERLRTELKLEHPLADGSAMQPSWDVPAWPMFCLIDATGKLCWEFTGHGPETGYLVKQELERLLGKPTQRNR
jgi:hypothetical protein